MVVVASWTAAGHGGPDEVGCSGGSVAGGVPAWILAPVEIVARAPRKFGYVWSPVRSQLVSRDTERAFIERRSWR